MSTITKILNMTPEQADALLQRVKILEDKLANVNYIGKYLFLKGIDFGPNAGTIGSIKSKIAFFGGVPVAKDTFHFNSTAGGTYGTNEQNIINALQAALKLYNLIQS